VSYGEGLTTHTSPACWDLYGGCWVTGIPAANFCFDNTLTHNVLSEDRYNFSLDEVQFQLSFGSIKEQ
jgi:hypothetical protein